MKTPAMTSAGLRNQEYARSTALKLRRGHLLPVLVAGLGFLAACNVHALVMNLVVQGTDCVVGVDNLMTPTNEPIVVEYTDRLGNCWRELATVSGGSAFVVDSGALLASSSRFYQARVGAMVYSWNVVGVVKRVMHTGTNLVANPLNTWDNQISTLFPNCPNFTVVRKWNGYDFDEATFFSGLWFPEDRTLYPGEGAMVVNPGAPFEVVFVGEVPEGNLSNPLPAGMSLISSKAPVQGLLDFPAIDGDMIQTWDPVAQAYRSHFYGSGVWDDPPVPVPGESFWLTTVANRTWTQDFGAPQSSANCPPVIEQQPLDQAADAGETVDFTVLASGSAPLSYQWRKGGVNLTNGTSISGATSAHLVITNVQLADAGDYTAVVTNAYGSVISSVAVLTVLAAPSHPVAEVYFTNAVVLANGYAQFEVQAPSADTSLVLLYSFDLKDWGYWTALSGSTNYVLQVPEPIANFSQVFCRAAPLGQAFHEFSFEFRTLWNGPLVNGTPALAWPQPLDNWQAILDVRNSTNFPPQGSVFFNGPAGSGIVDLPTEFWPDEAYTGSYESGLYPVPPTPPGAAWTVAYGTGQLTFNQPDPQTGGRYVLMVPQFAISNNLLTSVSWSYRNPDTGAVLASIPDFIESMEFSIYGPDYTQCGADDGTVFESPSNLGRQMTNWVLDVPMLWSNAMVQFKYEDTLKNTYRAYYTFGTVYEVFGANSYGALDYCDPAASGFTLLGSATSTATIAGAYNYYLVRVPKHNVVKVDTVQGSNQSYYPTYVTGNTSDYQNIGGAPDGLYATVGPTGRGFYTGGMFLIDAAGHGLTSLTVITVP